MVQPAHFGLTGGIACGKSTVARFFAELGARVIDADGAAHELLLPSHAAFQETVRAFGKGILDEHGKIDRQKLGAMVFADPDKLRTLNEIMYPKIIAHTERMAAEFVRQEPDAVVVVDAALIFEAGLARRFRKVVVAWCRREQQLARLMAKSGLSQAEAELRIEAQMSAGEKRRLADFAVDCSSTLDETRAQAAAVYAELQSLVRNAAR